MFVPTSLIGLLLPRVTWVFSLSLLCGTLSVVVFLDMLVPVCLYMVTSLVEEGYNEKYMMMFLCISS